MAESSLQALTQAIAAANAKAMKGHADKDPQAIAALFTENCTILVPGKEIQHGKEAVVSTMEATMKRYHVFQLDTKEVVPCGDGAYEYGDCNGYDENGDFVQGEDHKYLAIWRQVGGELKIEALMFNKRT